MENTWYKDYYGRDILVGDVVRWYFDVDNGYCFRKSSKYRTEMVDRIEKHNGSFYAIDTDTGRGAALVRIHRHCVIVLRDNKIFKGVTNASL